MENKYLGMTVNERLYTSGLMDEFDKAVQKKSTEEVRNILKQVDLNEESIKPIIVQLGL